MNLINEYVCESRYCRFILNTERTYLNNYEQRIHSFKVNQPKLVRVEIEYYRQSQIINQIYGKNGVYWASNEELTARVFATYVMDKLPYEYDYLVGRHILSKTPFIYKDKIVGEKLYLTTKLAMERNFSLNKTGRIIWDSIDGKKDIEQIGLVLAKNYSIEINETILNDVLKILNKLWVYGFVEWTSENPFKEEYIFKFNNYVIENITIDNVDNYFVNTDSFLEFIDAFIYSDTFENRFANAASIYLKRHYYFTLKVNNEKKANLILQLDSYHLIAQIVYFSILPEYIGNCEIIEKLVNESTKIATQKLGLDIERQSNFTNLLSLNVGSDIRILNKMGFKLLGCLENESIEGNVEVYLL